jgi:hypothetical protein
MLAGTDGWTGEAIVSVGVAILTLGLQQWWLHKRTKEERDREQGKVAQAIRDRDQKLSIIINEYPLHCHTEDKDKPLTETGIRYPNIKLNGGTK